MNVCVSGCVCVADGIGIFSGFFFSEFKDFWYFLGTLWIFRSIGFSLKFSIFIGFLGFYWDSLDF